jgi:hypothetical protein
MRTSNPGFSPVSEENSQKELARNWIYGTDDIGALFMEKLPKIPHQMEVSKSPALRHYKMWHAALERNCPR